MCTIFIQIRINKIVESNSMFMFSYSAPSSGTTAAKATIFTNGTYILTVTDL